MLWGLWMQQSGNLCQALGSAQQCQHDWEHLLELHGEPLQTPFQLRVCLCCLVALAALEVQVCMALEGPSPQRCCETEVSGTKNNIWGCVCDKLNQAMLIFADLAAAPEVTSCAPAASVEGQGWAGTKPSSTVSLVLSAMGHQREFVLDQHNGESRAEVTKSLKSYLALWGTEQSLALFCTKYWSWQLLTAGDFQKPLGILCEHLFLVKQLLLREQPCKQAIPECVGLHCSICICQVKFSVLLGYWRTLLRHFFAIVFVLPWICSLLLALAAWQVTDLSP